MYFDRHRGFALGLVLSGAGVGGLVLSPVMHSLITTIGIRWALKILGIWNLVIGIPVSLVVKRRPGFSSSGNTRLNFSVARRGTFIWQVRAVFAWLSGYSGDMIGSGSLPPGRWQYCPDLFLDDILRVCLVIFIWDRQFASRRQQYCQQRSSDIHGNSGRQSRPSEHDDSQRECRSMCLRIVVDDCHLGDTLWNLCFRTLVRCRSGTLYRLRGLLWHPCWRVQRPSADDDSRSLRRPELQQRERFYLLHTRYGSVLRSPAGWRHPRQSSQRH